MSAEQQLQNGDIVICMANGSSSLVGKSSFYDGNCHSPITVGAFCGIYRSKEPIVKWLFQTNKYRRYIWNSLQGGNWRKRSIPTHSGWLYPLTFDAEKGLKEA